MSSSQASSAAAAGAASYPSATKQVLMKVVTAAVPTTVLSLAAKSAHWLGLYQHPHFIFPLADPEAACDRLTMQLRQSGLISHSNAVVSVNVEPLEKGAIGMVYRLHLQYSSSSSSSNAEERQNTAVINSNNADSDLGCTPAEEDPAVISPRDPLPASLILKVLGEDIGSVVACSLFGILQLEFDSHADPTPFYSMLSDLQPRVYGSGVSNTFGMGYFIMEDYVPRDYFHLKSRSKGCSLEQCGQMLEVLGRLHGRTANNVAFAEHAERHSEFLFLQYPTMYKKFLKFKKARTMLDTVPEVHTVLEKMNDFNFANSLYLELLGYDFVTPRANYRKVIVEDKKILVLLHDDARLDNTFFHRLTGAAKLIDWQACHYGVPAVDVALVVGELDSDYLNRFEDIEQLIDKSYLTSFSKAHYCLDPDEKVENCGDRRIKNSVTGAGAAAYPVNLSELRWQLLQSLESAILIKLLIWTVASAMIFTEEPKDDHLWEGFAVTLRRFNHLLKLCGTQKYD